MRPLEAKPRENHSKVRLLQMRISIPQQYVYGFCFSLFKIKPQIMQPQRGELNCIGPDTSIGTYLVSQIQKHTFFSIVHLFIFCALTTVLMSAFYFNSYIFID